MSPLLEPNSSERVQTPRPELLVALKRIAKAPQDCAVVTQAINDIVRVLRNSTDSNADLQTAIAALSYEERDHFDTVNKQWLSALLPALVSQTEVGSASTHTEGLSPESSKLVSARNIILAAIFALLGAGVLLKTCADEPEASVSVTAQ